MSDRHDYLPPDPPEGDPAVDDAEGYAAAVLAAGPDERIVERDLSVLDRDPRESLDDPWPGAEVW